MQLIKNLIKKIIISILTIEARMVLKYRKPKIVCVTGSVGKTSTKDAITEVLSLKYKVRKSEKSYNSEFGVPLTILGLSTGWNNPYGWFNYTGNFETISGLSIPANTTITPNDRELKSIISIRKLKGTTIEETADNIEYFINCTIKYIYDFKNTWHPNFIEFFQPAAFTYASKLGDCDDFAILFQTMMHICGYGSESYVDISTVTWHTDEVIGHAYNRVLIENKWVVYDANAGSEKVNCTYPNKEDNWFHFNYYGTFTWR